MAFLTSKRNFYEHGDVGAAQALGVSHAELTDEMKRNISAASLEITTRALCILDSHGGDYVSAVKRMSTFPDDEKRAEHQFAFWAKVLQQFCSRCDAKRVSFDDARQQLATIVGEVLDIGDEDARWSSTLKESLAYLFAGLTPKDQPLSTLKEAKTYIMNRENALFRPLRVHLVVFNN